MISENIEKVNVFLGGTCNNSTWRDKIIPMLENRSITYFNPVVDDWTSECQHIENVHKDKDDVCLIVITSEMTGVFSIAEAIDISNKRPASLVFCVLYDGFNKVQYKSLKATEDLIKHNGSTVCKSLEEVVDVIDKKVNASTEAFETKNVLVIKPDSETQEVPKKYQNKTSIFLAGTIDMGNSENWQEKVTQKLDEANKHCVIYNPRRESWTNDKETFNYQVNWELDKQENCDFILMFIAGSSKSPITLLEMGLFARSKKLVVICEPEFYRYGNVEITCNRYKVPLYNNLDEYLEKNLKL